MTVAISVGAPSASDLKTIHAALSASYWSPGISLETVTRAWANSVPALARVQSGALIGFARAVSDRATFAWLADVYVAPEHRGAGVARALVEALLGRSELQNLRRWMLATRDAHALYAGLGFEPVAAPERLMQIVNTAPYGAPTS